MKLATTATTDILLLQRKKLTKQKRQELKLIL